MAIYAKCDRVDCFANRCGVRCDVLTDCKDTDKCSFFKTAVEVDQERANAHKRLEMMHREDLIKKYEYNPLRKW